MKNKQYVYDKLNSSLEKKGLFDVDYLPEGKDYITPDGNYKFERRNVFHRMANGVCRCTTLLFGGALTKIRFGAKVCGRNNLKSLKGSGAIAVCNHIDVLDTLLVKRAVGHFRSYHMGRVENNRKGFVGFIVRHGGFIPIGGGGSYQAQKNMRKYCGKLLQNGKIISFYPEQALWVGYEKP
ncbi:MAG: 1-acyl-sn-glycerol-3-phosphate acyltransferase, partial [Corallococcus sp.]|nr:1-acyl-sn-glycerol-3-phosphate acyltransferase [Corallococcus sp.]